MEKKNEKNLSWSETLKLNKRAYSLLYKNSPKIAVSRIIFITWTALTLYVGIYLSALIIEELSTSRNKQVLTNLVLITLISAGCITLISALLSKWRNTECAGLYYKNNHIFTEKIMDMDFADADDTKTHELYNTIEQNRNGGGWGLDNVYKYTESIISSILTLLGVLHLQHPCLQQKLHKAVEVLQF